MITCSLVVILYHHDRSLLAVIHCQTRISSNSHTVKFAQMFQKVNKQFYHKYNYFLLVSTVIIVNILLHVLLCLYHFVISMYDCLLSLSIIHCYLRVNNMC